MPYSSLPGARLPGNFEGNWLLRGVASLLPDKCGESLQGFPADMMFDPFSVDLGNSLRYRQGEEEINDQLMALGAATGEAATARGQFERAIGTSLYQSGGDKPFDDPQRGYMGYPELSGEVSIPALTAGGDALGDRLDIVFRLFAGVITSNATVSDGGRGWFAHGSWLPCRTWLRLGSGLFPGQSIAPISGRKRGAAVGGRGGEAGEPNLAGQATTGCRRGN